MSAVPLSLRVIAAPACALCAFACLDGMQTAHHGIAQVFGFAISVVLGTALGLSLVRKGSFRVIALGSFVLLAMAVIALLGGLAILA